MHEPSLSGRAGKYFTPTQSGLPYAHQWTRQFFSRQLRLYKLCLVCTLHTYMERTRAFRKRHQLFVSWAKPHRGKLITKQRPSHWIVDAITLAYSSSGLCILPGVLQPLGPCFGGSLSRISVLQLAGHRPSHSQGFVMDVASPSLAHAVLSVGS